MVTKLSNYKNIWKTVIGLEIHVQLNSKTKLFSIAPNKFHSPPNSNVSFFDMAMPGTLPIINSKCVELAILAATALNCEINYSSEFDRKHYFYGDLPAGYQITQQRKPIARNGYLSFLWSSSNESTSIEDVKKSEIKITQIHLEQDSGKSLHDHYHNISMIDLNRAGIGLIEVVTDCQFHNSLQAVGFVRELKDVLTECGICTGLMEEGQLRVDVNISVNREDCDILGERSEVKNINSLRGVLKSIEYELDRQITLLESGQVVVNETRFYDPVSESTIGMRDKENVQDYRYFPEPNLPILKLQTQCQTHTNQCMHPQICVPCIQDRLKNYVYPHEKRHVLVSKFAFTLGQSNSFLSETGMYNFAISVSEMIPASIEVALQNKWFNVLGKLSQMLLGELRNKKISIESCFLSHSNVAQLVTLVYNSKINYSKANQILKMLIENGDLSPEQIVKERKWQLINDTQEIEKIVRDFIKRNPKAIMYELKTTSELKEMTIAQLYRHIHLIEDRLVYSELQRAKFQCRSQGLATLRKLYTSQTQRFRQSNAKVASLQRQLYQDRQRDHFKVPIVPSAKKPKLNKRRKTALRRRTTPVSSPASTATFYSDSPCERTPSSSLSGTPTLYNSPQPDFASRVISFESLVHSPTTYDNQLINPSKYMDSFYSPSRSHVVDLDATPRI